MEVSVEVEIAQRKEKVWAVITDIENAADVISEIIDLKILHMPKEGLVDLKWRETRKVFGKVSSETMWITDAVENISYKVRAESHGSVYLSSFWLEELGDKTLLKMSFNSQPQTLFLKIISPLMNLMIKGSMKKMMRQDLEDIKHYIEDLM